MKLARNRKGQFIIIAAMLLSIMIVSISTVIYGTVTYYRQERWEEYVTIVDSIKAASCNLLRVGLANYTQTSNPDLNRNITRDFFNRWIRDVRTAYPAFGIDVGYALANRAYSVYGVNINYNLGLARWWGQATSYSASNATVSIDVASVGLTGYNFSSHIILKMTIHGATWHSSSHVLSVYLSVEKEGPAPVIGLQASNFQLTGMPQSLTLKRSYSDEYARFVYEIRISAATSPSNAEVVLIDSRGIKTVSYTATIGSDSG
jgi:hypothetical protein